MDNKTPVSEPMNASSAEFRNQPAEGRRSFLKMLGSLQCKATVLVVALTLLVTGLVSSYLVRSSVKMAHEFQGEEILQLSSLVARAGAPMLAQGDAVRLTELATEAANGAPLLYVAFTDSEGQVVAQGGSLSTRPLDWLEARGLSRPPTPGVPERHDASPMSPAFVDIVYPVQYDDPIPRGDTGEGGTRLVGYVRAGMDIQGWQRSMAGALDLVTGIGIIAIVVAIPLGFLLVRRIVAPLAEVSEAMGRFSKGRLDVRSVARRQDEIGELADAFNRMADEHQQTHNRIIRLNSELEDRVNERTEQLRELASREPLAGLYNRRHFNEVLESRFSEAFRYNTNLSCIMIDLDDFKPVNDRFGHYVGDEIIILAAETILTQLRSADLAARYGGDEFVVLLPQTDADQARVLGERISEGFSRAVAERQPRLQSSMSMGIASLTDLENRTSEELTRAADHALYEAKAAGKSCIIVAEPAADHAGS